MENKKTNQSEEYEFFENFGSSNNTSEVVDKKEMTSEGGSYEYEFGEHFNGEPYYSEEEVKEAVKDFNDFLERRKEKKDLKECAENSKKKSIGLKEVIDIAKKKVIPMVLVSSMTIAGAAIVAKNIAKNVKKEAALGKAKASVTKILDDNGMNTVDNSFEQYASVDLGKLTTKEGQLNIYCLSDILSESELNECLNAKGYKDMNDMLVKNGYCKIDSNGNYTGIPSKEIFENYMESEALRQFQSETKEDEISKGGK